MVPEWGGREVSAHDCGWSPVQQTMNQHEAVGVTKVLESMPFQYKHSNNYIEFAFFSD